MNIAAIGGGDKQPILHEITRNLATPNVLIVPSSCSTQKSYDRKIPACKNFFAELGLEPNVLHEFAETPSADKVAELVGSASLAYVVGGNMPYLLHTTETHGTDRAISEKVAADDSFWLSGLSAGALWPFQLGQSCPVAAPATNEWEYAYVQGLDLIPATFGVHADKIDPHPTRQNGSRLHHLVESPPQETLAAFAAENNAALVVSRQRAYVGRSLPGAKLHLVERIGDPTENEVMCRPLDNDELTAVLGQLGCLRP